ncbi:MAG: SET domain-containing protein-lysine N-methyltransferase [Candidatus Omnitrophica bacterium]|nr:SET domain-containing protein-lysine N-methyltransferase [Candidatus Omnitrophota bacterium]
MLPKKKNHPLIAFKKSGIHGTGVYARVEIKEGTKVIEYIGEKVTKKESERRAQIPLENNADNEDMGAVYIFELNKRYDLDGYFKYNTARYINHSCDPNCESDIIKGRVWIIALKDIKKGEEITYNYNYSWGDHEDHPCNCGTKRCVGYILIEEAWPKLKRKKRKSGGRV